MQAKQLQKQIGKAHQDLAVAKLNLKVAQANLAVLELKRVKTGHNLPPSSKTKGHRR
jgi:hypothetical protein